MSPTEAATPTACTCDCEEYRVELREEDREEDAEDDDWQDCECTFCGPVLEDGSRRCTVRISPLRSLWTAIQSGVLETAIRSGLPKSGTLPAFCSDCQDHCLLVRRCEAVIRAREAREHHQGQATKTRKPDSVLHRSRSRSR